MPVEICHVLILYVKDLSVPLRSSKDPSAQARHLKQVIKRKTCIILLTIDLNIFKVFILYIASPEKISRIQTNLHNSSQPSSSQSETPAPQRWMRRASYFPI